MKLLKINTLKNILVRFLCGMAMIACNEKIDFTPTFTPTMIVAAELTQETGIFKVYVAKSTPAKLSEEDIKKRTKTKKTDSGGGVSTTKYIQRNDPINDAKIALYREDASGTKTTITQDFEMLEGFYSSKKDINRKLFIGNKYWIEIRIKEKLYTSQKETLAPKVDDLKVAIKDKVVELRFKDKGGRKDFYQYRGESSNGWFDERLSRDLLFDGKEAILKMPSLVVFKDTEITLTLNQMSYSTFIFQNKYKRQENDLENSKQGGNNQLFSPPPANLSGNVYDTATQKRVIGNFNVYTTQTIKTTGEKLGVK